MEYGARSRKRRAGAGVDCCPRQKAKSLSSTADFVTTQFRRVFLILSTRQPVSASQIAQAGPADVGYCRQGRRERPSWLVGDRRTRPGQISVCDRAPRPEVFRLLAVLETLDNASQSGRRATSHPPGRALFPDGAGHGERVPECGPIGWWGRSPLELPLLMLAWENRAGARDGKYGCPEAR